MSHKSEHFRQARDTIWHVMSQKNHLPDKTSQASQLQKGVVPARYYQYVTTAVSCFQHSIAESLEVKGSD